MRLAPASRREGMTLIEVLASTALFLFSLVAIGELMSSSTDMALEVQQQSRATRLCQSKLNEFVAGVESPSGSASGTFEEEPDWNWEADASSDSAAANLYRVKVTVYREVPAKGRVEVSMTQYIFDAQQRGKIGAAASPTTTTTSDTSTTTDTSTTSSTTSTTTTTGTTSTGTSSTGTGSTGTTQPGTGGTTPMLPMGGTGGTGGAKSR